MPVRNLSYYFHCFEKIRRDSKNGGAPHKPILFLLDKYFPNHKHTYNYSCCISRLRIDSISNVSLIDACHIIPFSESFNDTITNGIALCPNLHRAFDRGLISISDDYEGILSTDFSEPNERSYGLKQFAGKKLSLPNDICFLPIKRLFEISSGKI